MGYYEEGEQYFLHAYGRYDTVLDHGEGVYLYDTEGNKYLDFYSGIGVNSLGYGYPAYVEAVEKQLKTLTHVSNYFYTVPAVEAAKKVVEATRLSKVFFCNSGAEATEGALKLARKYYFLKHHKADSEVIAFHQSFHGRTTGSVKLTGNAHYQQAFGPLMEGVKYATLNDLESVKALLTDRTGAIIVEPVQGEGGVNPCTKEFLQGLRQICDEKDICLILDEVQCGMGRTGSMFAWQGFGVKPDILTMAKAIGNGIPVGAFAMTEEVAKYSLQPGDHGATYGGNPLACTAVKTVIKIFERDHIVDHVNAVAPYLTKRLDELVEELDCVTERKGKGLMQGIVVTKPLAEVNKRAIEEGILIIQAQGNVIRFVPPLIVEEKHIDEMIEKLKRALA